MGKQAIHMFDIDFGQLKEGQVYSSLCGNRYIACEPPTREECAAIAEKAKDYPICKKCQKAKDRRTH